MANRWKGNLVANAATSDGTAYTGKANGAWGLNSQLQQKQASLWSRGIGAPNQATSIVATGAASSASIAFTPPTETGGNGAILSSYTAKSYPDGITGTGTSSPVTVSGLTNGISYTFTIAATNSLGFTGPESAQSNAVTPFAYKTVAFASDNSPGISAYRFGGGFSTKYTDTTFVSGGTGVAFSSAGNYLAVGYGASPYIGVYPWSTSGYGSRYNNPATLPTGVNAGGVSFNSSGTSLVVGHNITPWVTAYPWSSSGFGTKYANPATLPPGLRRSVCFDSTGTVVALSGDGNPQVGVYNWSNGFGTKYANPSSGFTYNNYGTSVKFNPSNSVIAVGYLFTAPFIDAFAWSGSGFGTRYSDPAVTPTDSVTGLTFNATGSALITAGSTAPRLNAYQWSSGFGTKYANPSTAISIDLSGITLDYSGTSLIASAYNASPWAVSCAWSDGTGFGSLYSDPSPALPGYTNAVAASSI